MKAKLFLGSALLTLAVGTAWAGSIANKATQQEWLNSNKASLDSANEACGSKIALEIPMDKYNEAGWKGYAPSCANVLDGIRQVCGKSDAYKKQVAKVIKTLVCQPTMDKKYSLTLNGSKVSFKQADPNISGSAPRDDQAADFIAKAIDK
jgi:hypothetical protein